MMTYAAYDAAEFPVYQQGSGSGVWWGLAILSASVATIYAALIASYFYLHMSANGWPPGYLDVPSLFWPTVGTGIRLAAEPCMILANKSAARDSRWGVPLWLGAAVLLNIGWMVLIIEYYFGLPYGWTSAPYGSIEWAMTAWSFLCVASLVIWGLVEFVWSLGGHFNSRRRAGLQALKVFWTVNFGGWIFFWLVIYFGARVFYKV
ncbi:MAG: hypothetical protein M1436_10745 [Acidobacteria bacterium]|nr:hypothetical protein [Acidobacteriota bacterium]